MEQVQRSHTAQVRGFVFSDPDVPFKQKLKLNPSLIMRRLLSPIIVIVSSVNEANRYSVKVL